MEYINIKGSDAIRLTGFNIDGEILLSDSYRIGDYEKVNVILPKDYLKFLITDRGILDDIKL
jgi:hypothetical protein